MSTHNVHFLEKLEKHLTVLFVGKCTLSRALMVKDS